MDSYVSEHGESIGSVGEGVAWLEVLETVDFGYLWSLESFWEVIRSDKLIVRVVSDGAYDPTCVCQVWFHSVSCNLVKSAERWVGGGCCNVIYH